MQQEQRQLLHYLLLLLLLHVIQLLNLYLRLYPLLLLLLGTSAA
jgi:hypothetical protein